MIFFKDFIREYVWFDMWFREIEKLWFLKKNNIKFLIWKNLLCNWYIYFENLLMIVNRMVVIMINICGKVVFYLSCIVLICNKCYIY